jgi:hypothetical protein
MSDDRQADGWKPPHISYERFTKFIDVRLGGKELPPRIDRGFLDNYAGSVQSLMLSALRTIGLIDTETGTTLPALTAAAESPEQRRHVLRGWATKFYEEQLRLAQANATAQMLHESFGRSGLSGSTLRKAVVFFLTLADDLELPRSPHFKPPRETGTAVSRKRRSAPASKLEPVMTPSTATGHSESRTFNLGEAGSVTLSASVSVLRMSEGGLARLGKVVRYLEEFERDEGEPPTSEDM